MKDMPQNTNKMWRMQERCPHPSKQSCVDLRPYPFCDQCNLLFQLKQF